jgi:hypothetical protein
VSSRTARAILRNPVSKNQKKKKRINAAVAGERAKRVRAMAALAEDLDLTSRTHIVAHKHL